MAELTRSEIKALWVGSINPARRDKRVYRKYYTTKHWKETEEKKLREKPICQLCRRRKSTQVHHDNYTCWFKEKSTDLIATCAPCHKKISH